MIKIAEEDDRQAFETFFNAYHARLIQFAMLFTCNYQQAEDVVSEVFIRILRKKKNLATIENIESYLFFSVKNESINHIKKDNQRRQIRIQDNEFDYLVSEYTDPVQKLIDDELRNFVTATIEALPPKRKIAYKLVKDEGMTYKQAAELLDISERTVEVHLKLAVKELRKALSQYLKKKENQSPSPLMAILRSFIFF